MVLFVGDVLKRHCVRGAALCVVGGRVYGSSGCVRCFNDVCDVGFACKIRCGLYGGGLWCCIWCGFTSESYRDKTD